jgi:hypothetical protein
MKILREQRGMLRSRAVLLGLKSRVKSNGMVKSLGKTSAILGVDALRAVVTTTLCFALFYPIVLFTRFARSILRRKPN